MRKTNKEIIDLFKTSWTDERVWVNINWNYYLHYDEENNDSDDDDDYSIDDDINSTNDNSLNGT